MLAEKYDMYHCIENYKVDDFLKMTTPESHPNLHYFKTMTSWDEFVTRDKDDYLQWLEGVSNETTELEILELLSLPKNRKVIVDTNIPHEVLMQISDRSRVAYMVTTTEISQTEWFNRMDEEKQFLLDVISKTENPKKTLKSFNEVLLLSNSKEVIEGFTKSGFFYVNREFVDDDINEKFKMIEKHFNLSNK